MRKFLSDLWLLTVRALRVTIRVPFAIIPNLLISLFFLLVYQGGLSGIAALPVFGKLPYINFILPVAVVSGAVGGAGGAGQSLIRDIDSGYFMKLRLSPVSRTALVLAPMIAGMAQLLVQTALIIAVAYAMGLTLPHGALSLVGLLVLTAGWGLAFAGYAVAMALRSKNSQAAQAATFVFFPLLFLSDTFVPIRAIRAHWMRIAAQFNPTTYVFNAMRSLLSPHFSTTVYWHGVLAVLLSVAITLSWASWTASRSLRKEL
ncbi:ABC transporter permease [Sulfobacillus sp. hq2]|uniref:ABC transporter permease n=2 Tax=Sulfobacillus TaxID=28033 RepID=UPI000CD22C95|nr:ABC transporter permease [Sulfobacillus sp. hq2]POB09566.1 ABC transporter [Sulfobacillus sp. hq2]